MRYQGVQACAGEYPIQRVCEVLEVSESGYYAWLNRPPSQREQSNHYLGKRIQAIWKRFRGIYGAPRIHAELQDQGEVIGKNRVAKLMQALDLRAKGSRKCRPYTTQSNPEHAVQANLLNQQFEAPRPDAVWLTDITYIDTDEGYLYVAGVLDLYSRQIVGLAMADHLRSELTETALDMALIQRCPDNRLVHHSDRGSQYTCSTYQNKLKARHFTISMSRTANCLDNAPMESFWATLKRECADHVFASLSQARTEIFSYIMGFYNRIRRHSALGYVSPKDFEMQYKRQLCTPLN
jgi:transposase InsO family protein